MFNAAASISLSFAFTALMLATACDTDGAEPPENSREPSGAEVEGSSGGHDGGEDASEADTAAAANEPKGMDRAGSYVIEPIEIAMTPDGCRPIGDPPTTWRWEVKAFASDTFTVIERVEFGGEEVEQVYACSGGGETFTCVAEGGFDYGSIGQDADVSLDIRYEGEWDGADSLAVDFALDFTCIGTACDEVAPQWTVVAFPCQNVGKFRAERQ